tara:strand:+ start:342 stop:737 length:396 start_codon:yes stop_codon:yes gene_type:complete
MNFMALPKEMRLKGHRTFKYIHKNSKKYYGKLLDFKIAKACPQILFSHKNYSFTKNLKLAITVSKKVSKKSVVRNKLRRMLHENFLKNFKKEDNHNPCWVVVNLKSGSFSNYEFELLKEFQTLLFKTGLLK